MTSTSTRVRYGQRTTSTETMLSVDLTYDLYHQAAEVMGARLGDIGRYKGDGPGTDTTRPITFDLERYAPNGEEALVTWLKEQGLRFQIERWRTTLHTPGEAPEGEDIEDIVARLASEYEQPDGYTSPGSGWAVLAEQVHDLASSVGSDVNNEGFEAQARYLLEHGSTEADIRGWLADEDEDEDEDEHSDGDGCATYQPGYQVHRNHDRSTTEDVEDLEVGDSYQDPAADDAGQWWAVQDVDLVGEDVHVQSTHEV